VSVRFINRNVFETEFIRDLCSTKQSYSC